MFIIVRNGKRVVYQGKITELSIKEITIKTIKKYELVQITEIIEISLGVAPLTFLIDDRLLTMAMKQKNYSRLHKSKSTDGRDHYFIFKVRTTNENKRIRIYEYQEMKFSIETKRIS